MITGFTDALEASFEKFVLVRSVLLIDGDASVRMVLMVWVTRFLYMYWIEQRRQRQGRIMRGRCQVQCK